MQAIIAIDPGVSGGIAVRDNEGKAKCWKMPKSTGDLCNFLRERASALTEPEVFMEQISGYTQYYGMQVLQRNFGFIQGVVMCCDMPLNLLAPQYWQSLLGLGKKDHPPKSKVKLSESEEKALKARKAKADKDWKNKLKERAQQLYPGIQGITLNTCDALLILRAAELELGARG